MLYRQLIKSDIKVCLISIWHHPYGFPVFTSRLGLLRDSLRGERREAKLPSSASCEDLSLSPPQFDLPQLQFCLCFEMLSGPK